MAVRAPLATALAALASSLVLTSAACTAVTATRLSRPVTCTSETPASPAPTAPGMLLCIGTTGYVPLTDRRDRQHLVEVAVTAVERVPRAEVDRLTPRQLGADVVPSKVDIYAVHASARLQARAYLDPLRDLLVYSAEHDFADPHVLATWSPDGCVDRAFTAAMPAGQTVRTCDWRWVARGADLTGVTLGSEINEYALYGGYPVSWSLREH